ncbi:hypothetical protein Tco_0359111 [Tanacetum coccineum]
MAAPGGANQIARHVIEHLIEFSEETFVDGYMSFFKSQQIAESRGFVNRLREEANKARNLVGQLNALISKMEALEDQGELFDTLMDLRDDREVVRTKLQGLNGLITQAEQEIKTKEALIQAMNEWKIFGYFAELVVVFEFKYALVRSDLLWLFHFRYGSILNILYGRNELLEKIMGVLLIQEGFRSLILRIIETEANDLDHLVNCDNDNDIDDLGYESEVYLDEEEEDENNHSNGNVVKRGITRLSKFRREYGKPDGIKLSVTFDALNRISRKHRVLFSSFLGDLVREHIGLKILSWRKVKSAAAKMARSKSVYQHRMERGRYAHVKEKMIENKEIKPDEEPPHGILWLKGRKETEDKIKEGTLKVDHGTDAMTVVLGKEKGGYARGVGSGVTYKRYFDLPRSRQASDERIVLLQSQLDNERRERQEKELEIQNLSNKMSQTEGMVTKLMNQLAAQGEQLKSMSTQLTPPDVSPVDINPIDSSADEEGGTPVVGCENDASIQKSNGLATSEKEMETRETVNSVVSKKTTRSIRKVSSRQDSQSQENVSPLLDDYTQHEASATNSADTLLEYVKTTLFLDSQRHCTPTKSEYPSARGCIVFLIKMHLMRSHVWHTSDFNIGEVKVELFCIQFGSIESKFTFSFVSLPDVSTTMIIQPVFWKEYIKAYVKRQANIVKAHDNLNKIFTSKDVKETVYSIDDQEAFEDINGRLNTDDLSW